jgi:hypothetical protein
VSPGALPMILPSPLPFAPSIIMILSIKIIATGREIPLAAR